MPWWLVWRIAAGRGQVFCESLMGFIKSCKEHHQAVLLTGVTSAASAIDTTALKDTVKDSPVDKCPLGHGNRNGAVVAPVNIGMNFCFLEVFQQFLGDEEVVEAPAYIAVACAGLHIPECIRFFGIRV